MRDPWYYLVVFQSFNRPLPDADYGAQVAIRSISGVAVGVKLRRFILSEAKDRAFGRATFFP